MKKEVKRLKPFTSVLRELYLKSGNECAFLDCDERMIQSDGTFIGEVCQLKRQCLMARDLTLDNQMNIEDNMII